MHWHQICNKVKIYFEFEQTTERAHLLAHFSTECFDLSDICIRKDKDREFFKDQQHKNQIFGRLKMQVLRCSAVE